MSLRKLAGALAALTLSVGLLANGVGAAFTDQVTAAQNLSVGTFGCQITSATAGTIAPDGKSLAYAVPGEIQAYTPSSAPLSFTVTNTGSIPVSLTVASWGLEAPFSSVLATPAAPVTIAAGANQVYDAGIKWAELGMSDLGKTAGVHYVVSCGEERFATTPAISFFSAPNYAGDGYLHNWISGVGFDGNVTVTVAYQFGNPIAINLGDFGMNPTSTAAGTWAVDFDETCMDGAGVEQHTDVVATITASDGTHNVTGTGLIQCSKFNPVIP